MGHDIKPLALGYAVAKFVGLGFVLDSPAALTGVGIERAEPGVGQGEVWVKLDGMLIKGYGFLVAPLVASLFSVRERFQRRQR